MKFSTSQKNNFEIFSSYTWWTVFEEATKAAGITVCPEVFPAATDSRFLRQKKIAAFGFSPMSATPILLHEHNEWIGEKTFLSGIDIYSKMLPIIVNAPILIDE